MPMSGTAVLWSQRNQSSWGFFCCCAIKRRVGATSVQQQQGHFLVLECPFASLVLRVRQTGRQRSAYILQKPAQRKEYTIPMHTE